MTKKKKNQKHGRRKENTGNTGVRLQYALVVMRTDPKTAMSVNILTLHWDKFFQPINKFVRTQHLVSRRHSPRVPADLQSGSNLQPGLYGLTVPWSRACSGPAHALTEQHPNHGKRSTEMQNQGSSYQFLPQNVSPTYFNSTMSYFLN